MRAQKEKYYSELEDEEDDEADKICMGKTLKERLLESEESLFKTNSKLLELSQSYNLPNLKF